MGFFERLNDRVIGFCTRAAIRLIDEKGDTELAKAILKSYDERPWLSRHIPWRTRKALVDRVNKVEHGEST